MSSPYLVSDAKPLGLESRNIDYRNLVFEKQALCDESEEPPQPKFKENKNGIEDEDEYPRPGSDPGLVVIFNQKTFENNSEPRIGTNRDVNELILTFGRLGYNIEQENVHNNKTRGQILDVITQLSKADHSNRNSLIVIVLTHGDTNNVLFVYDGQISAEEIWQPLSNCHSLRGKPKFFIFQACKGEQYSQHKDVPGDIIPANTFRTPLEGHMLIVFSTVEGSKAWRHERNGSWFIQELCKNFNAHGRRDDAVSLLLRVTKCVANNYYYQEAKEKIERNSVSSNREYQKEKENTDESAPVIKQMPLLVSTLTKKFYLCKSKDRNMLLEMQKKQEEILELIKTIKKS